MEYTVENGVRNAADHCSTVFENCSVCSDFDQNIFPVVPRRYPGKFHEFILWQVKAVRWSGSNTFDSGLKAFQAIIDFPTSF